LCEGNRVYVYVGILINNNNNNNNNKRALVVHQYTKMSKSTVQRIKHAIKQ